MGYIRFPCIVTLHHTHLSSKIRDYPFNPCNPCSIYHTHLSSKTRDHPFNPCSIVDVDVVLSCFTLPKSAITLFFLDNQNTPGIELPHLTTPYRRICQQFSSVRIRIRDRTGIIGIIEVVMYRFPVVVGP